MILACMLACMISVAYIATPTPTPTAVLAAESSPILEFVNDEREANNEKPLVENTILDKSAMDKACDMRDKHYWSHQDPQGNWSWHFFIQEGWKKNTYLGEDMGRNYSNDKELVDAWMHSPTHKEILLSPHYTDFGFARCGVYEVAHFGGTI